MDTPSWKKKLAAFGMVGGLVVLVVAALTQFVGGFTDTVPVTVTAARSGLVMESDAKVKLRGVEVGRVSSIEHTPDGAVLDLAMAAGGDRGSASSTKGRAFEADPPEGKGAWTGSASSN